MTGHDPFNPTLWLPDTHEHRIYGDDRGDVFALVDAEDYSFFSQWRWCPTKPSREHRRKVYMRRQIGNRTLYLHVEIMLRIEPPPDPSYVLVDHMNGDSLDCRRCNLRWATVSQNNKNLFGSVMTQGQLEWAA